jgi:hypothetical protein
VYTVARLGGMFAAALSLLSCTSDSPGSVDGGGAGDGGSGACQSAVQCPAGSVCAPAEHACVAALACATHADCGRAAVCGSDKRCARSTTGSPCTSTDNCPPGETCVGGFCGCMGQNYSAQSIPPNVLILLDRSQSMNDAITGGTKWTIAKKAITDLLAAYGSQIRFGLGAFPGTTPICTSAQQCTAGAVFVAPASDTAATINSVLSTATTCQGTPIAETLTALLGYKGLSDTTRPNYILLITDGQATCADPVPVVTSLRKQTPEVKTFAIGFGSDVDPDQLNSMAQQGGTAIVGGPPYYYLANDPASLANAFAAIAGHVLTCSYSLSDVPDDLAQLYVYQGKQAIARDTSHANGWDYDTKSNQLTFYGAACQALQSGQVSSLVIVYGCPLAIE